MPAIVGSGPGFVIDSTTIAVDYWPKKDSDHITHYFLTHCHSDHTANLDSKWRGRFIHCSHVTKNLLKSLNDVPDQFIAPLAIDQTHVFTLDDDEKFNVTLIDANHCPGAVMFLFEGYFGVVLATGDFRYQPSMFIETPLSIYAGKIDTCYLDNTYFNPVFAPMPTREQAIQSIIKFIDDKLAAKKSKCLFRIKLKKLGKEELLVHLAQHYNTQIAVNQERYNRLVNDIELPAKYFTKQITSDTLISVWELNSENESVTNLGKIEYSIEPSALVMAKTLSTRKRVYWSNGNDLCVPYSDHSSYLEIIEFVKALKPKQLVAIVHRPINENISISDLRELDDYLNKSELIDGSVKYRLLLKSTSSVRHTSRLNTFKLSADQPAGDVKSKLTTTRRFGLRKTAPTKTEITYESSPEKVDKTSEKKAKLSTIRISKRLKTLREDNNQPAEEEAKWTTQKVNDQVEMMCDENLFSLNDKVEEEPVPDNNQLAKPVNEATDEPNMIIQNNSPLIESTVNDEITDTSEKEEENQDELTKSAKFYSFIAKHTKVARETEIKNKTKFILGRLFDTFEF